MVIAIAIYVGVAVAWFGLHLAATERPNDAFGAAALWPFHVLQVAIDLLSD